MDPFGPWASAPVGLFTPKHFSKSSDRSPTLRSWTSTRSSLSSKTFQTRNVTTNVTFWSILKQQVAVLKALILGNPDWPNPKILANTKALVEFQCLHRTPLHRRSVPCCAWLSSDIPRWSWAGHEAAHGPREDQVCKGLEVGKVSKHPGKLRIDWQMTEYYHLPKRMSIWRLPICKCYSQLYGGQAATLENNLLNPPWWVLLLWHICHPGEV